MSVAMSIAHDTNANTKFIILYKQGTGILRLLKRHRLLLKWAPPVGCSIDMRKMVYNKQNALQ